LQVIGAKEKLCKRKRRFCRALPLLVLRQGLCPCTPRAFEKARPKLSKQAWIKVNPDLKFFGIKRLRLPFLSRKVTKQNETKIKNRKG